jgi:hypothetical protein
MWDILANQLPSTIKVSDSRNSCPEVLQSEVGLKDEGFLVDAGSPASQAPSPLMTSADEDESSDMKVWSYPQLSFAVDNAFLLGSPCAVFLMIRNQRAPLSQDFSLKGCSRVFNIFHPYDPVAYRIEPLLDPRNADVEPRIMTHWNGGFRVQYHTKRLFKKIVNETLRAQQTMIDAVEDRMTRIGLLDCNSFT